MKKLFSLVILMSILGAPSLLEAQTPNGPTYHSIAVKLGHVEQGSTARFKAMGDAHHSLGGDLTSLAGNPAGLGFYRSSDVSATPEFHFASGRTNWFTSERGNDNLRFGFASIGAVFSQPFYDYRGREKQSGFVNFNLGIGYHKTQNFNQDQTIAGFNPQSSMSQYFAESANEDWNNGNGQFLPNLLDSIAYFHAFIIDFDTNRNEFVPISTGGVRQFQEMRFRGSQGEWNIAAGANYENILYVGGSIGFTSVNYGYESDFSESELNDTTVGLNSFSMHQEYDLSGSGFYLKGGIILRPIDAIRIGITGQTKTFFDLNEQLTTRFASDFATGPDYIQQNNVLYLFDYNLNTPSRVTVSGSIFLGKRGVISADVEFVDYTKSNFENALFGGFFDQINTDLSNDLQRVVNYRVGTELNLGLIQWRGGIAFYPSPVHPDIQLVSNRKLIFSTGLGLNFNKFYLDMGLQRRNSERLFSPYVLDVTTSPSTVVNTSVTNVFFTLGSRF